MPFSVLVVSAITLLLAQFFLDLGSRTIAGPPPFWQGLPPSCRALMPLAAHAGNVTPVPSLTSLLLRPPGSLLCSCPLFCSVSLMASGPIFEGGKCEERKVYLAFFNEQNQNNHKHSGPLRLLTWSLSLRVACRHFPPPSLNKMGKDNSLGRDSLSQCQAQPGSCLK